MRLYRRIVAFGGSFVVSSVISLISFPLVIRGLGADTWAAFAAGTAVGSIAAVLAGWGWSTVGPSRVAVLEPEAQLAFWRGSLRARAMLVGLTLVPTVVVAWAVVATEPVAGAVVAAVVLASTSLSASWFFAGRGEPGRLFLLVTLPNASAVLVNAGVALWTGDPEVYVATMAVTTTAAVLLPNLGLMRRSRAAGIRSGARVRALLGQQRDGVGVALVSTVFVSLPMVVVSALFPRDLPVFAMADRLYRLGRSAVTPVTQAFQSSIPAEDPAETTRRMRGALVPLLLVGLVAGAGFATLSGPVGRLLSDGQISLGLPIAAPYAVALLTLVLTSVIGLAYLVPTGRGAWMVRSVVIGAGVGVLVGVPLAWARPGGLSIALAVGAAEVAVLVVQIAVARRTARALGV